ncbi:hypothetical protein GCM10027590_56310 [Nocardiopsis nanhaiensis]
MGKRFCGERSQKVRIQSWLTPQILLWVSPCGCRDRDWNLFNLMQTRTYTFRASYTYFRGRHGADSALSAYPNCHLDVRTCPRVSDQWNTSIH